jgi:putative ABC transport system permease protein
MNFTEAIFIALSSLRANRLRSVLTLLGIVIGVTAVIAVISFISGLNDYVAERIFNLGPDVFTVTRQPAVITSIEDFIDSQRRKSLTLEDMEAVREFCSDCRSVGGVVRANGRVKYGREFLTGTGIQGYTSEAAGIVGLELDGGRFITEYDVNHARNVCIIGYDVVDYLFPFVDPIGKTLMINDEPFQVVGIGVRLGSAFGQSRDNWTIIPMSLHQKMFGSRRSIQIYGKAGGEMLLASAADQARVVMRARHHLPYESKDDFSIATNENLMAVWRNISRTFFAVTTAIASISLVVGGIVVMNIMLVSVTERTREIGIRKATGARRRDILVQFLVESATLSLVGGLIGIAFGSAIAIAVSSFTPLPASIKWWAVLLGIVVSTGIGLFFGIYPARKAAKLDPIVALRYE